MIHRAVLGSLERFFGVLIEHYAGDFPLWFSPVQVRILPVTDTQVCMTYYYEFQSSCLIIHINDRTLASVLQDLRLLTFHIKLCATQLEYCKEVISKLKGNGIRAEVCQGERLPKLIRNAEKQKIPLMAVVGPKEAETQTVTIRSRFSGEVGTIEIDDFISRIKSAIERRTSL
jgi:threonyl-tRNA synthetase